MSDDTVDITLNLDDLIMLLDAVDIGSERLAEMGWLPELMQAKLLEAASCIPAAD